MIDSSLKLYGYTSTFNPSRACTNFTLFPKPYVIFFGKPPPTWGGTQITPHLVQTFYQSSTPLARARVSHLSRASVLD